MGWRKIKKTASLPTAQSRCKIPRKSQQPSYLLIWKSVSVVASRGILRGWKCQYKLVEKYTGVIHHVNGSECVQRMRSHVWNVWERMVQMETYGCKLALGVGAAGPEAD